MSEFAEYVELLKPICEGMQRTFGNHVEFILHDLSKTESSVVLVAGNLTKRQLGAPATNILIKALSEYGVAAKNLINYPSMSKDGKVLKSSTIFIRNKSGKIIGCFCINVDVTAYKAAIALLQDLTATVSPEHQEEHGNEIFAQSINDVVEDVIHYEIDRTHRVPLVMSKAEKVEVIRSLDRKGIFDVKGSPEMVAGVLGTSVFTIYNYIKEARNEYKQT